MEDNKFSHWTFDAWFWTRTEYCFLSTTD